MHKLTALGYIRAKGLAGTSDLAKLHRERVAERQRRNGRQGGRND